MSTKLVQTSNKPKLPAFMQKDDVTGTEDLGEFVRPPRIRVVQALSKDLIDTFDNGDVVLLPQKVLVSEVLKNDKKKPKTDKTGAGDPFWFVPLFFWPEWISWNPRELTDLDAIRFRTTDPNDPLVAKCRNRELWYEPHPDKAEVNIRNVEHLNFVIMLMSGEFTGTEAVVSFSRAEHRSGTNLAGLIKMRKAPIFGCVFQISVGFRENPQGQWYGLDVTNPDEKSGFNPFIQNEEVYSGFRKKHEEFKSLHEKSKLEVVHDEDPSEDEPGDSGKF